MSDASLQGKQNACQKQLNYYCTTSEEDRLQQMRGKQHAEGGKKSQNRQEKNHPCYTWGISVLLLLVSVGPISMQI